MNSVVECTRMCFRQVWENTQENDCREERSWYRSLETGGMVWRCGGATQKQKEQEENMGKRLCCGFHQGTSEAGWEDIGLATLNIFSWRRGVGASSFSYLALVWFGGGQRPGVYKPDKGGSGKMWSLDWLVCTYSKGKSFTIIYCL